MVVVTQGRSETRHFQDDTQRRLIILSCHGIICLSHRGCYCSPPKTFLAPNTVPPLEVLRVPTRTMIGSMLFSAIRGYCNSLNYYSRVAWNSLPLDIRSAPTLPTFKNMLKTHDTSFLTFLLHWLTIFRVRAANFVRRPCSDSSHVTAPYKLPFYNYKMNDHYLYHFIIINKHSFRHRRQESARQ